MYSKPSRVAGYSCECGEIFLRQELSKLKLYIFAVSIDFPAWQLLQLPSHVVRTVIRLDGVNEPVQPSHQAVSHVFGRNM